MKVIRENFLILYGKIMYLRWRFSGYDHVGRLVSEMVPEWKRAKILDVGSGGGEIASDERLSGVDITCLDADRKAIKECKKRGLKARRMDVREVVKHFSKDEFDVIWCVDVIEHLEKKTALKVLTDLEKIAKRQVIVFLPLGFIPQDIDTTGLADPELNKHRSYWEKSDFLSLGYKCKVLKGYHWDIRYYCSSFKDLPYPVVRDAMWAVKTF